MIEHDMGPVEARKSPGGYIAQRFCPTVNNPDHAEMWALTYLDEHGNLAVRKVEESELADWPAVDTVDPSYAWSAPRLARMLDEVREAVKLPIDALHKQLLGEAARLRMIAESEGS